jgi:hypothetical protein
MSESLDATANELGVYRHVGGWVQGYPDGPWPTAKIQDVIAFDPAFRLLWVVNVWKTPNEGIVKTGSYMIGREVKNPYASREWIKGLRLSQYPVDGVRYTRQIMAANILDGLTDSERNAGKLPRFEPFTSRHVESLRKAIWQVKHVSQDEEDAIEQAAADEAEQKAFRQIAKDREDEKRERALHNRVKAGRAARTFVSDTLVKLRETAGMPMEAV